MIVPYLCWEPPVTGDPLVWAREMAALPVFALLGQFDPLMAQAFQWSTRTSSFRTALKRNPGVSVRTPRNNGASRDCRFEQTPIPASRVLGQLFVRSLPQ